MSIETELNKLKEINSKHHERINETKEAINTLNAKIKTLTDTYADEVNNQSDKATATYNKLESAKTERNQLNTQLDVLQASGQVKPLQEQANITLDTIKAEIGSLNKDITGLETEYNNKVLEAIEVAKQINDKAKDIRSVEADISMVTAEYKDIEAQRNDIFIKGAYGISERDLGYKGTHRLIAFHRFDKMIREAFNNVNLR